MDEEWREIPGYPRYEASTLGRIRGPRGASFGSKTKYGYMRTTVRGGIVGKSRDIANSGRGKEVFVHRMIAIAFIPNPENKPFVNHIDSDRSNNVVSNLEWVTHLENFQHAWAASPAAWGHAQSAPVMTPEDVQQIRRMSQEGHDANSIAYLTKRKYRTVLGIIKGRSWRHLPWP